MRWLGAAALALALGTIAGAQRSGLTAAPQLEAVYDAIFDARFAEVASLLRSACPPAPAEACQLLDTVALWWQIQIDPDNKTRDAAFARKADAVIGALEARVERERDRAEVWFYLGGAYGARAQFRVLRGDQIGAARDGKRIKDSLERALMLDPELHDAHFGIGLYRYYADVAPAFARVMRWLLMLPGGNRVEGLQQMLKARDRGQLLRSEADYQLHVVYLWYEKRPERGLELLRGLRERHPRNPHFLQRIAEVEDRYLRDERASLTAWQALLEAAEKRTVAEPVLAATAARLGIAGLLDRLHETDLAVPHLRAVVEERPAAPFGAVAAAQQALARAQERLGDRAYKLSIDGWRAFERGAADEASRLLAQSLMLAPGDPVTQYRQARVLAAQNRVEEALVVFADVHRRRDTTPPHYYVLACVDAARLKERQGERAVAIDLYRTATQVDGGDRRLRDDARRALARLGAR